MISVKYATLSLVHNVAEAAPNKVNSGARLTTGLRVANARDNASSFAIANDQPRLLLNLFRKNHA